MQKDEKHKNESTLGMKKKRFITNRTDYDCNIGYVFEQVFFPQKKLNYKQMINIIFIMEHVKAFMIKLIFQNTCKIFIMAYRYLMTESCILSDKNANAHETVIKII